MVPGAGALDVMLAEYRSLADEIRQRTSNQFLILGGAVALMAATVPLYRGIPDPTRSLVPMVGPLLLFFVGWLYFEQDVFITHVAGYLHRDLRPRIQMQLVSDHGLSPLETVLRWESYRRSILFGRSRGLIWSMAFFRALFVCAPTLCVAAVVILRFQWQRVDEFHHHVAVGLAVAGCLAGLWLSWLAGRVVILYARIAPDDAVGAAPAHTQG